MTRRWLVLTARGTELRGSVRHLVHADSVDQALEVTHHSERDAAGTRHLSGDLRSGDRLWVAAIDELRILEPEAHRPTLPADALIEAPEGDTQ